MSWLPNLVHLFSFETIVCARSLTNKIQIKVEVKGTWRWFSEITKSAWAPSVNIITEDHNKRLKSSFLKCTCQCLYFSARCRIAHDRARGNILVIITQQNQRCGKLTASFKRPLHIITAIHSRRPMQYTPYSSCYPSLFICHHPAKGKSTLYNGPVYCTVQCIVPPGLKDE